MRFVRWVKSSYSDPYNDCVEVASTRNQVRDSKDVNGPVLTVDVTAFVGAIKSGRFDR